MLYNKVNQLYIYICSHTSSLLHLPPSHPPYPTSLGDHKALANVSCVCLFLHVYVRKYVSLHAQETV